MATYIKSSIKTSSAISILEDMERNINQYFFFIARSIPWTNDVSPETYTDSVLSEYDVSRNIIGYKKIRAEDILFAIRRYDWIGSTVYDQYSDSEDLFTADSPKIFYVYTVLRHIYKCLDNAGGAPSTVVPDLVIDTPFTLADGYVWKYLGSVTEENEPDTLTTFLPIEYITDSANTQTQNQYNTQLQAVSGQITRIEPPVQPTGTTVGTYPKSIPSIKGGLVVSGVTNGNDSASIGLTAGYWAITIDEGDSIQLINEVINEESSEYPWSDYIVRCVSNDNNISEIGNYAVITNFNTEDMEFIVRSDVIDFVLTTGEGPCKIEILPYIKVIGDGIGAYVYPVMAQTDGDQSKKYIDYVVVGNGGYGYSRAMLDVIAIPYDNTTNPELMVVLPPKGGHGSNIISELKSSTVFINAILDETEQSTILVGGTYRQFGIVKNPKLNYPKGAIAGSDIASYRDITVLNTTSTATATIEDKFPDTSAASIGTVLVLGTESLASVEINDQITSNDTTKKIVVQAYGKGTENLITTASRPKDYFLGIGESIQNFISGEEVTQYIAAGTTFTVLGITGSVGVSYGFGVLAKGIVLPLGTTMSGNTLGVQVTQNNFYISSAPGATLMGSVSGATGTISSVDSRFGELIHTIGLSGGATFTTQNSFKVLEVGPYYFSGDVLYTGLEKVRITDANNGLTADSYQIGDLVIQGSTGDPDLDFASGTVYKWTNTSVSGGILDLTDVVGIFKTSGVHGITASKITESNHVVAGVTLADIDVTSGEIIYIDNVLAVDRTQDQTEQFRLTISF